MTGCLAWCLMVWWFVSASVRAVGCWLCCRWGCRGFAQLREGSDDPPPPVSLGASAWADATPRPASRPSRTIIIAMMRRRRETRCITRRPLTNTKRNQHRLHIRILPVEKPFCLSMPALHRIMRIMAEASRLLDIPRFHPTTRSANNTQARGCSLVTMILLGWGNAVVQSNYAKS